MRTNYRVLNVENVEDRSVPSSFRMIEAPAYFAAANDHSYLTLGTATFVLRGITADGRMVNVRIQEPVLLLHEANWFGSGGLNGAQPTQPISTPVVGGGVNDDGPAESGTSPEVGSASGPTIGAPHLVAHNQLTSPGTIAISIPTEAPNATAPVQAAQAAEAAIQTAAVQASQIQVLTTSPVTTGHNGPYANTAIVGPSDQAVALPPGPSAAEPVPVPTPPPAIESEEPAPPATTDPVSGFVPIDISTLRATANQFLGRVADLAPAWPDGMPTLSNSLWMAAIGVLGGGAIYAATNRPERPARDAFGSASAMSEWERRNARSAG